MWRAERPYNALPRLPAAGALETTTVLRACIPARAALGELKKAVELIPNPAMLVGTLPVLEAQASSEIENVVTTADALFQGASRGADTDPATKEALRYRRALLDAFERLDARPLSTGSAEAVCSIVMGREMTVRRVPGTALANPSTRDVIYTPPEGEQLIRELLADWERFLHEREAIDPLIRMAAAHYQFEAIHPFTDGNGRTGRILNSLFLVEKGLLPMPILYLSKFILASRPEYYAGLLAVTSGSDWESWLVYMMRGVEETARWTTAKIDAIRRLFDATAALVKKRLPKIYSRELIDVLFEQPYRRIANVVDAGIVERQAASRYLKSLSRIGVLEEHSEGRDKLFIHRQLLELLMSERHDFEGYG